MGDPPDPLFCSVAELRESEAELSAAAPAAHGGMGEAAASGDIADLGCMLPGLGGKPAGGCMQCSGILVLQPGVAAVGWKAQSGRVSPARRVHHCQPVSWSSGCHFWTEVPDLIVSPFLFSLSCIAGACSSRSLLYFTTLLVIMFHIAKKIPPAWQCHSCC